MIVFLTLVLLASATFALPTMRQAALQRRASDWLLDVTGLLTQGVVIPLLQSVLVYRALAWLAPQWQGRWTLSPLAAFLLNFVVVDYLYYWNHRWLHTRPMWPTHATHHTAELMDVFITSRNTLWASLLIVYVWANGLFAFLLSDPSAYLFGATVTASLDLWRHTRFAPRLNRALRGWLITPNEHAWHHSRSQAGCNFGANFSLWDRWHGTWFRPNEAPEAVGIPSPLSWQRKLLFPFVSKKAL